MAKFFKVSDDNKLVVWILAIMLTGSIFISTVPDLQFGGVLYGALSAIGLFFYTNPGIQGYLTGIPKKRLFISLLIGVAVGVLILFASSLGLSVAVPLVPASVDSTLKWIIICLYAPFVEEIFTRGALLGLIKYLEAKGRKPTNVQVWVAIISQAIFFTILHLTAYSNGWYSAPTFGGALAGISAISAGLISAFIFGIIMGFLVTRKGINSLGTSIVAHYVVNQWVFTSTFSIFVWILPLFH